MITLRREETGVLVMELSEHLWPDNLELAIPVVHDVARSRRNPLLLLVVIGSDFDTPLWDFLSQILQPGILAENRPSRVAVLTERSRRTNKEFRFRSRNSYLWLRSRTRGQSVAFVIRDSSLLAPDPWVIRARHAIRLNPQAKNPSRLR